MLCYYSHSLHPTPRPPGDRVKPGRETSCRETCSVLTSNRLPFRAQLSASLRSMNWSFSVFTAKRGLKSAITHSTGRDFEMRDFLCVATDCYLCPSSMFEWWEPEMCKHSQKNKAHCRLRGWHEACCQSSMYKGNKQLKNYIYQVIRLLIAHIHLLFL